MKQATDFVFESLTDHNEYDEDLYDLATLKQLVREVDSAMDLQKLHAEVQEAMKIFKIYSVMC